MKIAVASDNGMVAGHFGHCENFNVFHVEGEQVVNHEVVANPGHKPGFLPNFLNDLGVNVIIAGGMGGGAVQIFNEKGIEVVVGVRNSAKEAAELYLKGELESTGSICHEHQYAQQHAHDHGEHGNCGR